MLNILFSAIAIAFFSLTPRLPPSNAAIPGKLAVYERYLRTPHYIVYSRYSQRLRYFKLIGG